MGALWRGTGASLVVAVPAVGVYLPLYDALAARLKGADAVAPALAGGLARTMVVVTLGALVVVWCPLEGVAFCRVATHNACFCVRNVQRRWS